MSKQRPEFNHIDGIGLGIVAFEGTEHLASIITEFRDIVDYVVIGLQRKSYHGDPIDPTDLNEIFRLKDENHLVDSVLEIELDTTKEPRIQETDKRNMLIQDIEDHGCSHAIVIDSDEYYSHKSILKAVQEINEHDYEITYCQYVNYYADYKHFLVYPFKDGMYVPFITKTKYRHKFECYDTVNGHKFQFPDFALPSDPTRRYIRPFDKIDIIKLQNNQKYRDASGKQLDWMPKKHYTVEYHVFPWEVVKMHHLSWLRADMRKKINNWSSKTCFENYNDLIDKAIDVYNHFDHNSKEEQKASLLFNTPNHEVFVRAFPKQYIHPKYDYLTRLRPVKNEKKIAIMNLSTTNSEVHLFEKLEECGKETWAKDVINGKYPNIDYWTVIDCKEESHIDTKKHIIYVKTDYTKDNISQLTNRFLEGYEILTKYKKYNYVIRTNTSTWINIEFINEMLAYETDDSKIFTNCVCAAFWSRFDIHLGGGMIIMSDRNMDITKHMISKIDQNLLYQINDDVLISQLWHDRARRLGFENANEFFVSLSGDDINDIKLESDDINNNCVSIPIHRVKTDFTHDIRLGKDIEKMKKFDNTWKEYRKTISDEEFSKFVKDYMKNCINKNIITFSFTRNEWINAKDDKTRKESIKILPYNEETFKFLEDLKIKNKG